MAEKVVRRERRGSNILLTVRPEQASVILFHRFLPGYFETRLNKQHTLQNLSSPVQLV